MLSKINQRLIFFMTDFLEKIKAFKIKEVRDRQELFPVKLLERSPFFPTQCVSLSSYIKLPEKNGIIAEFKRKSPSKGFMNQYADVMKTTLGYMQAGASALSVLTDEEFFGGKSEDLRIARVYNFCPVLRKDFILSEYQVIESKSIGADAILLIAAFLEKSEIDNLSRLAKSLKMEVLFEMHSIDEIDKIPNEKIIVGINHRNLKTLEVDLTISEKIISEVPDEFVKVAESGIKKPEDVFLLRKMGFDGFLIGELFMKNAQPNLACRDFINQLKQEKAYAAH
jgi:indole-3-glycerol phosphate synthase